MSNCVRTPYSLAGANALSAARRALRLCLPILLWMSLPCLTLPAMAGYIQANVPKVLASDPIGLSKQGFSVAVSSDGNTAIVGGPFDNSGAGAAWVFTRNGGTWTEQQKLTGNDLTGPAQLGWSVALSANGNIAIVGGPGDNGSVGAAWIFTRSGTTWSEQAKLVGTGAVGNAEQGYSVALSGDGATAIVGGWADNSALGAAWVFTSSGGTWTQNAKLVDTDYVGDGNGTNGAINVMQGFSVALSGDGRTAILGGPGDSGSVGAAWVFTRSGSGWTPRSKLAGTAGLCNFPMQGFSVALDHSGTTAIIGGPNDQQTNTDAVANDCPNTVTSSTSTGAAWVWTLVNGIGSPASGTKLGAPSVNLNPGQGFSVALGGEGRTALVGGATDNANTGAAWVFTYTTTSIGTQWIQGNKLVGTGAVGAAGQASSIALSVDGTTAIMGGPLDQDQIGAAWVFVTQNVGLAVGVTGNGSVTSSPPGISCGSTCSADFGNETNVSLTATPSSGWAFSGWSGACSGSSNCTVTMTSAQSVTATFAQLFTLTVSDNGAGSITSSQFNINCQTTCGSSYQNGTQVTLTATPQSGYIFAGWTGACSGSGSCVVTMSMAENVTATFYLAVTFVSGVGDDTNPCSRTAPCKTFAGAISQTGPGGEIDCIDLGGFGTVTITKAITIDCQGAMGYILASATNGINVSAAATDLVILRNLGINGAGTTPGIRGINIVSASAVTIENVKVFNFSQQAIADTRTTPGTLTIINTDTHTNLGAGLGTAPSGGALNVFIDGMHSFDNGYGVALGPNTSAMIRNSDFTGNTTAGIDNEGALIVAVDTAITGNGTGVLNQSNGITRLANTDIVMNTTAINNATGFVVTYGTNRNPGPNTGTITPAGAVTSDIGQQ